MTFNYSLILMYVVAWELTLLDILVKVNMYRGGSRRGGGGTPGAPPKIGNNMIFWRNIVIFHAKYLNNFRASLHSAQFF